MGDRRQGDRREKPKGEITIKFKDAIMYLILAIFIIVSVSANIILLIRNKQYKEVIEYYESDLEDYSYYDDYYDYYDEYEDNAIDENEVNNEVNNEL